MSKDIIIREFPVNGDIEVFGHVFHGLREIVSAVGLSVSSYAVHDGSCLRPRNPATPVDGVHVAEIWMPYPCFDAEDRMYENRTYQNYFFSSCPITPSCIRKIVRCCIEKSNFQLVNEDMPLEFAPALYYVGDYGKMLLATAR